MLKQYRKCVQHEKRDIFEECIPGENLSQVTNKESQEEKIQVTQQKNDQRKWKHVSKKKYTNVLETFERYSKRKNIQGQEEEQAYKGILKRVQREPRENQKPMRRQNFQRKKLSKILKTSKTQSKVKTEYILLNVTIL